MRVLGATFSDSQDGIRHVWDCSLNVFTVWTRSRHPNESGWMDGWRREGKEGAYTIQFTQSGHQLLPVQLGCPDICMKPNLQGHTTAPLTVTPAWEEDMNSYINSQSETTRLPGTLQPSSSANEESQSQSLTQNRVQGSTVFVKKEWAFCTVHLDWAFWKQGHSLETKIREKKLSIL